MGIFVRIRNRKANSFKASPKTLGSHFAAEKTCSRCKSYWRLNTPIFDDGESVHGLVLARGPEEEDMDIEGKRARVPVLSSKDV